MNIRQFKWIWKHMNPFISKFIWMFLLGGLISLSFVFSAILSKLLIDSLSKGSLSYGIKILVLFSLVIVLQMVASNILTIINRRLEERMGNQLRADLLKKLLHSEWMKASSYHSDDLLTRMTRDVGVLVNTLVTMLPESFTLIISFSFSYFVLASYNKTAALISLVAAPAGIALNRLLSRKIKKYSLMMKESEGEYRAFIHELLQNISVVKGLRLENRCLSKLFNLHNINFNWNNKNTKVAVISGLVMSSTYWLSYIIVFGICCYNVYLNKLTFGTVLAFTQLFGLVHNSLQGLIHQIPQMYHAMASVDRLLELDELEQEIDSSIQPGAKGVITVFEDVTFSYEAEKPLLKGINFAINKGEVVAITGLSGEGKTTLVKLMLALVKPKAGRVYYVSRRGEVVECNPQARSFLSYVPQGNTLFSGTIRENLIIGNPNAVNEELIEALRRAEALDFVMKLPRGLDSRIGERGIGLSEGQAQRLAIARALLVRSHIMILDEATSSLDVQTEEKIIMNMKEQQDNKTFIIITHRPSAMKLCDRVLKLDRGLVYEKTDFITDQGNEAV